MEIRMSNFRCLIGMVLSFLFLITACKGDKKERSGAEESKEVATVEKETPASNVFLVTTRSMEFSIPTDTMSSGWNTIRYRNNSNEVHLILFDKYPEGKGLENARNEVIPVFQKGMDHINEGNMEAAQEAFGELPEWFQEVEFTGGVGLISPNTVAESTIWLEPGTYIMECYVKMANGTFHSMQMTRQIQVTENKSAMEAPQADYVVNIDAKEGITFNSSVNAGKKTFEVNYGEQKVHEHYLQHDVNIVRIDEGADISKLEKWMDWSDPKGLQTPSPEGFRFLGGVQEMKTGDKGYFTVDLRPGQYALISEVPKAQSKAMLKTFTVQ